MFRYRIYQFIINIILSTFSLLFIVLENRLQRSADNGHENFNTTLYNYQNSDRITLIIKLKLRIYLIYILRYINYLCTSLNKK